MSKLDMKRYALCFVALGAMGFGRPAFAAEESCSRACMKHVLDEYISAVFLHNPGSAPLAAEHRTTENTWDVSDGDGIWKVLTGYGGLQRRYFDPSTGQAAFFGLLKEGDATALVSVRVRIEHRKITEAEWTINMPKDLTGLTLSPPFPEKIRPASQMAPRDALIAPADAYFQALMGHDGNLFPHQEGCERVENGHRVTHLPVPPTVAGQAPPPAYGGTYGDCGADFQA